LLQPEGIACIEIGLGQEPPVTALFEAQGFAVSSRNDLGGRPRCLILGT
jgi:release factor glutamine methyltransferase